MDESITNRATPSSLCIYQEGPQTYVEYIFFKSCFN